MVEKHLLHIPIFPDYPDRRIYIYLPNNYHHCTLHYPVLYMLDGQNVFFDQDATYGKSWDLASYLDYTNTPLIVVAVECNQNPNQMRLSEYGPYDFQTESGIVKGKGEITMDWLIHSLKPLIDESYRTQTDRNHCFIAGSSMGGLLALYALLAHNDVFSKAAALSISFLVDKTKLTDLIQTATLEKPTVLYLDKGENELHHRPSSQTDFHYFSTLLMNKGIATTIRIVPDGNHCEASWEKQVPFFIQTLLY